jgi:hypothetical protein
VAGPITNQNLIQQLEQQSQPQVPQSGTPQAPAGMSLVPISQPNPKTALEQQNLRTNIDQGQTSIANTKVDNIRQMRQEFQKQPAVQNFQTVLPLIAGAEKAEPNKAGDLNLVYAFGKVMDPGSVVREGEQVMATNVGSVSDKVQGYLDAIAGQGQLTPKQRLELVQEMRLRRRAFNDQYSQLRDYYAGLAKSNGFDPNDIVGPNIAEPFRDTEKQWFQRVGGTSQDQADNPDQVKFNDSRDVATMPPKAPEWRATFQQKLSTAQPTPDGIHQAALETDQQLGTNYAGGLDPNEVKAAADAMAKGVAPQVFTPQYPKPDISDVRGNNTRDDQVNAAARGVGDVLTSGLFDKAKAGIDTLRDGGSYGENLNREYAISDFDQANHPYARLTGQLLAGMAIPFGYRGVAERATAEFLTNAPADMAVGELRQAARQAGARAVRDRMIRDSAAVGAAYNAGSSRSLDEVPLNAVEGASLGAAGGAAAGQIGVKLAGRAGPEATDIPLVDPDTLELNQPLDAARPAERYQAMADAGFSNPPMAATGGRTARVIDSALTNLPPSAGVMEDAATVTAKDARTAALNTANKFGTASSFNEGGTAVQKGVQEWLKRAEGVPGTTEKGLVGKVYDAIPIAPKTETTLTNTRAALTDLTQGFESNPELSQLVAENPKLRGYLDALTPKPRDIVETVDNRAGGGGVSQRVTGQESVGGGLSWQDMKAFRSEIGDMIGDRAFIDTGGTTTSQLRALYGALSEDMRATAQAQGPKALSAFERANGVYQAIQQRKEQALVSVLGKDALKSPEDAAKAIQKMALSSGGDLKNLAAVRASTIKSGQWNDLASSLIRMGGLPAKGEGRAWNPQTFVNWYSSMTEPARNLLFGGSNKQLRQALDGFVAINQQLAKVKGMANTSQTAPNILGARAIEGVTSGAVAIGLFTHPLLTIGALIGAGAGAAGNYGLAKLWTSPRFVKWATGYTKMLAGAARSGKALDPSKVETQMGLLDRLGRAEPGIAPNIAEVKRRLSENPNGEGTIGKTPEVRITAGP